MSLLQMSISGAVLILAIVVIRVITINKLPKKTFLVLWGIVLLRLLIPFSIPSIFSIYSLIDLATPMVLEERMSETTPVIPQGQIQHLDSTELPIDKVPLFSVWFVIWCIGMIICTTFFVISYLRCRIEFQSSLPVHSDYAEQWLKEHSLKRSVSIRQSDRISSPLTYGIFRPVILMPKRTNWTDTDQLQYILTHEYVHVCRYDTVTKLITTVALCIHWFNPMVWMMYLLFNRDMELACDESVVRQFGEISKSAYSFMLINMKSKQSGLLPFCNNFSKNAIEERIVAIMKIKKTTIFSLILACLIVVGTITAFATSAAIAPNTQEKSTDLFLSEENSDNLNNESVSENDARIDSGGDSTATDSLSLHEVMNRILTNQGLDSALEYKKENINIQMDKIILLCTSESGKYEAYGFVSPEYGMAGILLNNIIDGDDNWNYFYESWSYSSVKPALQEQGEYNVIFSFTQDGDHMQEIYFDTYDTGTMSARKKDTILQSLENNTELALIDKSNTTDIPIYTSNSLGIIEIPVTIDSLNSGSEICIGEISDIRNANKIQYNIQSKSGGSLYIGIRSSIETDVGTRWFNYIGSGSGNVVWENDDLVRYDTEYTGNYYIFVQSKYGNCTDINGSIEIEYNK